MDVSALVHAAGNLLAVEDRVAFDGLLNRREFAAAVSVIVAVVFAVDDVASPRAAGNVSGLANRSVSGALSTCVGTLSLDTPGIRCGHVRHRSYFFVLDIAAAGVDGVRNKSQTLIVRFVSNCGRRSIHQPDFAMMDWALVSRDRIAA